jgi:hypothetical protein
VEREGVMNSNNNNNSIGDAQANTNTKTKREKILQSMPKNYVDQSRLCAIAIETFIREIGKLSEVTADPYLKAYTQKMLFDMHIKKAEFYRDFPAVVKLTRFLESRPSR